MLSRTTIPSPIPASRIEDMMTNANGRMFPRALTDIESAGDGRLDGELRLFLGNHVLVGGVHHDSDARLVVVVIGVTDVLERILERGDTRAEPVNVPVLFR